MDFDSTNASVSAADAVGIASSSACQDSATQTVTTRQAKRPVTVDSSATDRVDYYSVGQGSKRRRRDSTTNTESSSSVSSIPAERNPISASYSSMLRYQTRVTVLYFFPFLLQGDVGCHQCFDSVGWVSGSVIFVSEILKKFSPLSFSTS